MPRLAFYGLALCALLAGCADSTSPQADLASEYAVPADELPTSSMPPLTVEQRELAEALAADEEFVQYMKIQMERARPMTEAFLALSPEERAERQAQLLEAADRFKAEVEQMETMTPEEQQALIDEQRALMAELGVPTPMPSADEQADMQRLFTRHPGLMKLSQEEVQSVFATAMSVSGAFEEVAP